MVLTYLSLEGFQDLIDYVLVDHTHLFIGHGPVRRPVQEAEGETFQSLFELAPLVVVK
jgi:hypothetical protein